MGIFFFCFLLIGTEYVGRKYFLFTHGYSFSQSLLYVKDTILGYRHNSDYMGVEYPYINKGFRNVPFSATKPKGTIRIVCFGGSSTFGYLNSFNESYPYYLQNAFKGDKKKIYEVINAGVNGYNILQIALFLREMIPDLKPDIVVINSLFNNFNFQHGKLTWYPITVALENSSPIDRLKAFLLSHSVIYAKLQNSFQKFLRPSNFEMRNPVFQTPLREDDLLLFKKTIIEILKYLISKDINVLFVKQPLLSFYQDNEEKDLISDKLGVDIFKKYSSLFKSYENYLNVFDDIDHVFEGVTIVDGYRTFKQIKMIERVKLFNDIVHLSSSGNRILANEIGKAIKGRYKNNFTF